MIIVVVMVTIGSIHPIQLDPQIVLILFQNFLKIKTFSLFLLLLYYYYCCCCSYYFFYCCCSFYVVVIPSPTVNLKDPSGICITQLTTTKTTNNNNSNTNNNCNNNNNPS